MASFGMVSEAVVYYASLLHEKGLEVAAERGWGDYVRSWYGASTSIAESVGSSLADASALNEAFGSLARSSAEAADTCLVLAWACCVLTCYWRLPRPLFLLAAMIMIRTVR